MDLTRASTVDASLAMPTPARFADCQPSQERLKDVELEQFLRWPAVSLRTVLQVEVGVARGRAPRDAAHSKISSVFRIALTARGNDFDILTSSDGCPPWWSHRLSASFARSAPSMCRKRNAPMMLRSAE